MGRIVYIHWNQEEAAGGAARLRRLGHTVRVECKPVGSWLDVHRERPPHAFVIDLDRLPSLGREVGGFLRRSKATRHIPLVYVGGEPEKIRKVQSFLPDAVFAEWKTIAPDLRRALKRPPSAPVVPGTMEAYAGRTLSQKLGFREDSVMILWGAPRGFETTLGPLPRGAIVSRRARRGAGLGMLFARSRADLETRLDSAFSTLGPSGALWIAWPKQASGLPTDLTQAQVRAVGLASGYVDYKICSIDTTWSGLLFSRRKRKGRP